MKMSIGLGECHLSGENMTTEKQILAEIRSEISDLKLMVQRIHGYVVEMQEREHNRLQTEADRLSKPATLTVNEDHECME